jgi:hypothetical protein
MSTNDMIELRDGAMQVDATLVAAGLQIEPSVLQQRMRDGLITTLCEQGVEQDSGRYRLTFFSPNRRFRIVVDQQGRILQRLTLNLEATAKSNRMEGL